MLSADGLPTSAREALVRRLRHPFSAVFGNASMQALDDVSFEVQQGEILGLIGANGAGKSTLLKVLTRITTIDAGRIEVFGRVGSLLEVGTGFHQELTGRENVYLNGAILGMSRQSIDRRFDEIVDFAEIGRYIDTPVKRFSSGMAVRLAFSVSAHLDAEVLLVDEVLAVGDVEFQRKCTRRLEEISTAQGRTIIFVSHNMAPIRTMCDRVMHLARGHVDHLGDPAGGIERYLGSMSAEVAGWDLGERSPEAVVCGLSVHDGCGSVRGLYATGEQLVIRVELRHLESVSRPVVGLRLTGDGEAAIATFVTPVGVIRSGVDGRATCEMVVPALPLNPGRYSIDVWVTDTDTWQTVDTANQAGEIEVEDSETSKASFRALFGDGAVRIPAEWRAR